MVELRREPAGSAASRALWAEYMALVTERLGASFAPTEEIFATEAAFTVPGAAWLVGYEDRRAVCCGGLRPLEPGVGEIKRMFVTRSARGRGHGRALLAELERLAAESGCRRVRLFTTEVLVEARALYESAGYRLVATVRDGERNDFWLEKALSDPPARGTPTSMERDPHHEPADIEPDDATPSGAEGGDGAPAPFETPDEDPRPVEEAGEELEREHPGGDA